MRSETLPREAASARRARRIVRQAAEDWKLDDLAEATELVVTELVANAAQHARCASVRVTVQRTAEGGFRVAVTDRSHRPPICRQPGPGALGGRGLVIVAEVAARWGYDPLPWGKRVWAEVTAS
ncbi:ATP-binding protein [Streptomyces sp. NPDC052309]|uniref:ATP-binding protein n=1 Tax=Streptomyces sp. NPDC052309 TaxID=3155421 RepID=UPI0034414215